MQFFDLEPHSLAHCVAVVIGKHRLDNGGLQMNVCEGHLKAYHGVFKSFEDNTAKE